MAGVKMHNDLMLYDTLTGQKQVFKPITPGNINMYVCGNTVYDDCHLGHARAMVSFDVIVRHLKHIGYQVKYVRNITDIDDKIITRANERSVSIDAITTQYINAMHEDSQALSLLPPDSEPRATAYIEKIIALIQTLISKKYAYVTQSGDVCFEVTAFNEYGKLSNRNIESLLSGVRIEVDNDKKSPLDFVLWKQAKPGEPSWPSPWGDGRPGWHIECSAMAMNELDETFDIHGGGLDLQFPHHENEIAQSEAATDKTFANYWMHVGLLQINGEKMSKSLGNFFTIQDVLSKHPAEVVRYFLISGHYRSPLNYTEEQLTASLKSLTRLYTALDSVEPLGAVLNQEWVNKFNQVMNDDFNTPEALAVLFALAKEINKTNSSELSYTLKYLGSVLGILQLPPSTLLQRMVNVDEQDILERIASRKAARDSKNWALADKIRDDLLAQGIELLDSPQGTTWRVT